MKQKAGGFSGLDRQPQVYIDGNLWGCRWAHNDCGAVPIIVEFIKLLASKGIQTTVILDGAVRHHSKRATTERLARREKARVEAILARMKITKLTAALETTSLTTEVRDDIIQRRSLLEKTVSSRENACRSLLDAEFGAALSSAISAIGNGSIISNVKEAMLQADPVIIRGVLSGDCDLVVSSDSDFAALLGENGLQLSNLKYSSHTLAFTCLKLLSSSQQMIENIANILGFGKEKIYVPNFPLFQGLCLRMRVLSMIALGCDA